jgi:hypothetical protein
LLTLNSCNKHDYNATSVATIEKPSLKQDAKTKSYYSQITFNADSCGKKISVNATYKSDVFMYKRVKAGSEFIVNYDSASPHHFQILDYKPMIDSAQKNDTVVGEVISVNEKENYCTYRFKPDSSKKMVEGIQELPPKQKNAKTTASSGDSLLVKYVAGEPKYSVLLTDSIVFVKKNTREVLEMKKYDFHGMHGLAFINAFPIFGLSGGYQYAFNPHFTLGFSVMSYYATHKNLVISPEARFFSDQRINFFSPFIKISACYVSMNDNRSTYYNASKIPRDTSDNVFLGMNSSNTIYTSAERLQTWGFGIAVGMLDYGMHNAEYHRKGFEFSLGVYYYNPPSQLLKSRTIDNQQFYYHGSDFQNKMFPVPFGNKTDPSRGNYRLNFLEMDVKLNFTFRF